MARPAKLSGATATLKVDGVDVKDYGMIINSFSIPMPGVRDSTEQIPLRDGDIDLSKAYEANQISFSGDIMADSHADYVVYYNALRNMFHVKQDGELINIEFQDKTGFIYKCRLVSFDVTPKGLWFSGAHASFTLTLKVPDPFQEKTSETTEAGTCSNSASEQIAYAGNIKTPLNVEITPLDVTNLMGGVSEATTGWSVTNAAISTVSSAYIYGDYALRVLQSGAGAYDCNRSILSEINTSKYYALGVYTYVGRCRIKVITDGPGGTITGAYSTTDQLSRAVLKIQGSDFVGASSAVVYLDNEGTQTEFKWDGFCMVEITAAEYADSTFKIPPYTEADAETIYLFSPRVEVIGKNLCPLGKEDLDSDNWYSSGAPKSLAYDQYIGRNILIFNLKTFNAISPSFQLPAGTISISFKYRGKATGTGAANFHVQAMTETAETANAWGASNVYTLALTVDDTWRTVSTTFTAYNYVPLYRVLIETAGTKMEWLKIGDVQMEFAAAPTTFQTYKRKYFEISSSYPQGDLIIIDGEYKKAICADESGGDIDNLMQLFTGNFLELQPGTNNVFLRGKREDSTPPEKAGTYFNYLLKYRERYL